MNIRQAGDGDYSAIRETVSRSFRSSYALSPQDIETVLESEFSPEAMSSRVDTSDARLFLAEGNDGGEEFETDAGVVGFAELDDEGALQWLHVHPEARGQGVGTALVECVRSELEDDSTPFTARLFASAQEGDQFLERFGLYLTGNAKRDIGGQEFDERVYATEGVEQTANEPLVTVPDTVTVDGQPQAVRRDEEVPGTTAPFYPVYGGVDAGSGGESDPGQPDAGDTAKEGSGDHERRIGQALEKQEAVDPGAESETPPADRGSRSGFFCSACGSTDVSMDSLERIECNECGNVHRADEWDAAYL